jgi:indoleamine 2,3-dioxygenase
MIEALPQLSTDILQGEQEVQRAMLLLLYLGHAYVWGMPNSAEVLPKNIAMPWYEVAKGLGRPPVLSYASHALYNWRLLDEKKPISLHNIVRLQNFYGGIDEDWFVLIHIAIEAKAGPAIAALVEAQTAVFKKQPQKLHAALAVVFKTLKTMGDILGRMTEHCDPYIYYNRVRPFIYGWMKNPSIPNGVLYSGVQEWKGQPQKFRGETGAQSSIIMSIDAALNINFDKGNPFYEHLIDLRKYMPVPRQIFVETLEKNANVANVRDFVTKHQAEYPNLTTIYNACLEQNHRFRNIHLEFARNYINKQVEKSSSPTNTGTGGTPFLEYLKQHCDDVLSHQVRADQS